MKMDDDQENKTTESSADKKISDSQNATPKSSSPQDIPAAGQARIGNFIPVGSPVNMLPSILAG